MITSTKLELAVSLAKDKHYGQMYGKHDYIVHLQDVADMVKEMVGNIEDLQIIAYLHDIMEDTGVCENTLNVLFDSVITNAVKALSKSYIDWSGLRVGDTGYINYIKRVKKNPLALIVKIADTTCNLAQSQLDSDTKRIEKYSRQLALLQE